MKPPCIGVDLGPLLQPLTGIGTYVLCLLRELLSMQPAQWRYPLYTWRATLARRYEQAIRTHLGEGWGEVRHVPLPGKLMPWLPVKRWVPELDLLHLTTPICGYRPGKVPTVVTVHDLAWLRLPPEICPPPPHAFLSEYPQRVRDANQIVCVSEATRRDVLEILHVPEERVRTAPLAARPGIRPPGEQDRERLARAAKERPPYFLMLGTLEPRKNVPRVLKAFSRLVGAGLPHRLVLAGKTGWGMPAIRDALDTLRLHDRVHLAGYVDNERALELLWGAEALLIPSLYEGFGLPALEAMAAGTPVIASRAGSLPEVGGEAALLVDPLDEEQIADAMVRLGSDDRLRETCHEKGLTQAARFTWKETARITWNAYTQAWDSAC